MRPEQMVLTKLVEKPRTVKELADVLKWGVDKVHNIMTKLLSLGAVGIQGTRIVNGHTAKVYFALRERVERPTRPVFTGKATPWDALLRR